MESRLHIIIYGAVQGVFFRANTKDKAYQLGLRGWVKNNVDGTVEIMAEGDKHALEKLLEWCFHGPQEARVDKIKKEWLEATGEFSSFNILL